MNEDVIRLVLIIKSAPKPFGKTDSELAQEYRNWYLGSRLNMKAAEHGVHPTRESLVQKGKSKSKKVAKPARG